MTICDTERALVRALKIGKCGREIKDSRDGPYPCDYFKFCFKPDCYHACYIDANQRKGHHD